MATISIHDIANELLETVFLYYVEAWHSHRWETRLQALSSWTEVLLHVCSRWTSIAISSTPLWAHMCLPKSAEQLQWQLNRSGDTPLQIFSTDFIHLRPGQLVKGADKNTERRLLSECFLWMERLELNIDASAMAPLFLHISPSCAPRLTHLVMTPLRENEDSINAGLVKFLAEGCPNLLLLELRDWNHLFNFSSLPKNLETIRLHVHRDSTEGRFSLDCIAPLKNLRILDLRGSYISRPIYRNPREFSGPLELPNLRILHLTNTSIKSAQKVLKELGTPPFTSLHIESKFCTMHQNLDDLCDTLVWLSQPIEDALDTLWVGLGSTKFTANWRRSWNTASDDNTPVNITLSLNLPGDCGLPDECQANTDLIVQVCRAITSETLTRVVVKYFGSDTNLFKSDDWIESFGAPSFSELRELVVENCPWIWDFVRALCESYDEQGNVKRLPFFPAVKNITLRQMDLENNTLFHIQRLEKDPGAVDDSIEKMLVARYKMGVGIDTLTLDACEGLGKEGYEKIRAVVDVLNVPTTGEDVMKKVFGSH
ncbi:hypothetical protein DL96DRAFT_570814 [Flagelloscypha sp. PMI_526]|nr:hypothetical protein DL96DRAFT_570814 [Flagelloscypha sp. PMI_526]